MSNRDVVRGLIDTLIEDNNVEGITPLDVRTVLLDMVSSAAFYGSGTALPTATVETPEFFVKTDTDEIFWKNGLQNAYNLISDRVPQTVNLNDARTLNKKTGVIGDGTLHPLSEFYATLGEAQADYPNATALTQSVDQVVILWALENGIKAKIESGIYVFNYKRTHTSAGLLVSELVFDVGSIVTIDPALSEDDNFLFYTNLKANISFMGLDCAYSCRTFIRQDNCEINYTFCTFKNGGLDAVSVSSFSSYVEIRGTDYETRFKNCFWTDIKATANDADSFGSGQGSARFVFSAPTSGVTRGDVFFENCILNAGESDARELDLYNQNTSGNNALAQTYFNDCIFLHNTNTRRNIKNHEGICVANDCYFLQHPDFVPAAPVAGDPQSEVGVKTLHCVSYAGSGTRAGEVVLNDCFVDYRAFTVGFIGGASSVSRIRMFGGKLVGPKTRISRFNLETSSDQRVDSVGFAGPNLRDLGSTAENVKFVNGGIQFRAQANNQKAIRCEFIDPLRFSALFQGYGANETYMSAEYCRVVLTSDAAITPLGSEKHAFQVQGGTTAQVDFVDCKLEDRNSGVTAYRFINIGSAVNGRAIHTMTPLGNTEVTPVRYQVAAPNFIEINTNYRTTTIKELDNTGVDLGGNSIMEVLTDSSGSIALRIADAAGNTRVI